MVQERPWKDQIGEGVSTHWSGRQGGLLSGGDAVIPFDYASIDAHDERQFRALGHPAVAELGWDDHQVRCGGQVGTDHPVRRVPEAEVGLLVTELLPIRR